MKCFHTLALVSILLSVSPSAPAADKVVSLLATLSTAKAQVEGRAERDGCQVCATPVIRRQSLNVSSQS
jgi:hypothetical protein